MESWSKMGGSMNIAKYVGGKFMLLKILKLVLAIQMAKYGFVRNVMNNLSKATQLVYPANKGGHIRQQSWLGQPLRGRLCHKRYM